MTSDQTLPEPLELHEIDAVLDAYWNEPEFADWRIQGATDPEWEGFWPDTPPTEASDYDTWREMADSLAFSEALASVDWDAELHGITGLGQTGS